MLEKHKVDVWGNVGLPILGFIMKALTETVDEIMQNIFSEYAP